ncbi:MAG: LysR family transcriptional regulator [Clostridia bacterium]|nr:LysR family transcriptional regulator [Clostridia bacterium]
MNDEKFINAKQIAQELDISDSYGYKIIRQLNAELRRKGYITLAGRVSRPYFYKRFYDEKKEDKG